MNEPTAKLIKNKKENTQIINIKNERGGASVPQSVESLTSAQVTISQFVGSSPTLGSVLTAQSLEPASDSVSLSLSLPLPHSCSVSQK